MFKKVLCLILSSMFVFILLASCGNDTAEETPYESETVELKAVTDTDPSESEEPEEEESSFIGEWSDDTQKVTIEDDTVTIEYLDDDGEVTETYWVGSYDYDPDAEVETEPESDSGSDSKSAPSDDSSTTETDVSSTATEETSDDSGDVQAVLSTTWTSVRDPEAEMTCKSDTLEFTWSGDSDNVFEKISYAVENEDGTTTTVTLDRTDGGTDVTPSNEPVSENKDENSNSSASDGSSDNKETTDSKTSASDSKETTSSDKSDNRSSDKSTSDSSGNTSTSDSGNSGSGSSGSSSGNSSGSTSSGSGSSNSGSSSSGSSGSSASSGGSTSGNSGSSGSSSSGNSGSSGSSGSSGNSGSSGGSASSSPAACSHNYVSSVTKAATCSAAGTMTYTCSKCGASYTETIPATGNHNYQPVYTTVHHDEVGHYETTAVYGTRYVCGECGWYREDVTGMSESNQGSDMDGHQITTHGHRTNYTTSRVQVGTTSTWVVDSAAYDEQVISYYKCSVCGATK